MSETFEPELDPNSTLLACRTVDLAALTKWLIPLADFLGDDAPYDDAGDWLLRDMIPRRELSLLAGAPKVGKTWIAIDMAIAIASGRDWAGFSCTLGRPARVLFVEMEDNRRRVSKRVYELLRGQGVALADLEDTLRISDKLVRWPLGNMDAFVTELKDCGWIPDLIIIDSLTRVMNGDQNSTRDAAAFGAGVTQLSRELGAAVCLIHHTRKAKADEAGSNQAPGQNEVRGSGDLVALARHIVIVGKGEGDTISMRSFGNIGEELESHLKLQRSIDSDGRHQTRISRMDASEARQLSRGRPDVTQAIVEIIGGAGERGIGIKALYELVPEKLRATGSKRGCGKDGIGAELASLEERGMIHRRICDKAYVLERANSAPFSMVPAEPPGTGGTVSREVPGSAPLEGGTAEPNRQLQAHPSQAVDQAQDFI